MDAYPSRHIDTALATPVRPPYAGRKLLCVSCPALNLRPIRKLRGYWDSGRDRGSKSRWLS